MKSLLEAKAKDAPLLDSRMDCGAGSGKVCAPSAVSPETFQPSEGLFRQIIESTHEGIWMADMEGVTRFANPQMARMLGCDRSEMIGHSVFEFVFPEDHETVRGHFAGFLAAGQGVEVQERLRRKDGEEIWALVAASVFPGPAGQAAGFLGMFADITGRKRTEDALRQSEANLQLQIARMPIGHILWSPEFRVLSWNPCAERIFGYSESEALGKHPYDLIVAEASRAQVGQVWQRLLQGDTTAHSVNENLTNSGQTILCEWSNTPIRDGQGTVIGVLSMVQDVTLRRRAEEALRTSMNTLEERVRERTAELRASHSALEESELKFRRLFDTISDAAFVFDAESRRLLEVNEAALQLYGYSRENFLRLTQRDLTAEPEESEASIRLVLAGATPRVPLRYHRKKDGTVFPVEISASSFAFQHHTLVCGIIRDITFRKQAEEALRRREQELADFFAEAPLGLLWVDPSGRIERVNAAQLSLLGRPGEEVFGQPITQFYQDDSALAEVLARLARGETVQNLRARVRRRDGTIRDVLVDANGLWDRERLVHSRWFVRDITHSVELEREILAISEQEQRRLGQDLHDDLCQQLVGIEFLCQRLAARLGGQAAARAQAAEIAGMVQQALVQTRELARGLSPFHLEAEGLPAALRELAARTRKVFRVDCRFEGLPLQSPVPSPQSAASSLQSAASRGHLYRIAQEAIANALKHGKARRIRIRLSSATGGLRLVVRDNGVGLPEGDGQFSGMGLRIMRYRAEVVGGSLDLQRNPRGGTTVLCLIPGTSASHEKGIHT